ncbi:MAG: hypothetical protein C0609_12290 [Deltaproteobacteria bacterium]|nr:MAG: hypothetical protein C0609_12290 [Deltaproteobacteria bacterium]
MDPIQLAEQMLRDPRLAMLGCQHAYIAAGALLGALRNKGAFNIKEAEVDEVFSRLDRQAIGGYCGLTGVCGITPAIGAVFALLTGSKCGTNGEQRITMEAATRTSSAITGLTGPSCCKAYMLASIAVAADYLAEALEVVLPISAPSACEFSSAHPHGCREGQCPYFTGEKR